MSSYHVARLARTPPQRGIAPVFLYNCFIKNIISKQITINGFIYLIGTLQIIFAMLFSMKNKPYLYLFFTLICYLFLSTCKPKNSKINRAFYYWKSVFKLQTHELKILEENKVSTLYIKYFDVVWNEKLKQPIPVAKIKFEHVVPAHLQIVPVVYITNKVMLNLSDNEIEKLAKKITSLVKSYNSNTSQIIHEIQIDCDWTVDSKEKYFELLTQLKNRFQPSVHISATIRLHQIKYATTTGIPPLNKGMLMYYNMGNIQSMNSNSIFNEADAEKYAPYIKQYPLQLDIVLPVFTWVKVFRQHKLIKLLNQTTLQQLSNVGHFKNWNKNTLQALNVGQIQNFYFLTNDLFVEEKMDPIGAKNAAQHLQQFFNPTNFTLSLFHLHQENLNEYTYQNIENLYTTFD